MDDLFVTKEGKAHIRHVMKHAEKLNLPDYMEGYTFEKEKRIRQIIKEENGKKQAMDNYNIRFINLKQYVYDMLDRGFTFQPQKVKKSPKKQEERDKISALSEIDVIS